MSLERFDHLLGLVENNITKENTNFCKAISAEERLAVTLHQENLTSLHQENRNNHYLRIS